MTTAAGIYCVSVGRVLGEKIPAVLPTIAISCCESQASRQPSPLHFVQYCPKASSLSSSSIMFGLVQALCCLLCFFGWTMGTRTMGSLVANIHAQDEEVGVAVGDVVEVPVAVQDIRVQDEEVWRCR